jgi:hypothetical protein
VTQCLTLRMTFLRLREAGTWMYSRAARTSSYLQSAERHSRAVSGRDARCNPKRAAGGVGGGGVGVRRSGGRDHGHGITGGGDTGDPDIRYVRRRFRHVLNVRVQFQLCIAEAGGAGPLAARLPVGNRVKFSEALGRVVVHLAAEAAHRHRVVGLARCARGEVAYLSSRQYDTRRLALVFVLKGRARESEGKEGTRMHVCPFLKQFAQISSCFSDSSIKVRRSWSSILRTLKSADSAAGDRTPDILPRPESD